MYWLDRLFRKEKTEKRLDSEMRFHLEQRSEDFIRAGMSAEEARRLARIEFGGMEAIKEECRESRKVHLLDTLLQDGRYGLRMMLRSPGFTAVAVLTLALGIGANSAIFSVVNGVLLNPLPFPDSEQLVGLHENKVNFENGSISYANFRDWQKQNHTFSSMAITRGTAFSLTGMGDAEQLRGEFISSDFFTILGVRPVIGRTLAAGEDEIGAAPVALISEGQWQQKFGSGRDVLGRTITLDGRNYTIIGVVPASLDVKLPSFRTSDVYVPIGQWSNPLLPKRSAGLGIHGIGRLKPGVRIDQARADMDQISRSLAAAYPENKGISAGLLPLKSQMVGQIRPFLVVLLCAVGFVLLIACVNVANLLLARSNNRTQEFAVRVALGASKSRVLRQLLTESVLLALAGGAIGLLLAAWGTQVLLKLLPITLPRAGEVTVDTRVLLFTMLVALLSGILFGMVPALRTSRADVARRINEGSRNVTGARHRVQNVLVVAELGMALVLLTGAGLMIRSLTSLWNVDPGFDPHNILTFNLSLAPPMMKASAAEVRAGFREIEDKLKSFPGIEAASFSWGAVPLENDDEQLFWMEGQAKPASPNDMNWTLRYVVDSDYLKIMRTPLLEGRFLETHDDEHSPPVVVIDETFARKFFPNQDPVGKRINLDDGNDESKLTQIVGVVKHVKQWSLADDEKMLQAQLYSPFMQLPDPAMKLSPSGTGIVVRSKAPAPGLFESVRAMLRQLNQDQVASGPQTMEQIVAGSLGLRQGVMMLLGGFAVVALALASVGIYGVISYVVGERTHEIGIRMALGARRVHVLNMVLSQGTRLILIGVVIGVIAALALTRMMASLLFGVTANDPFTFFSVAVLLLVVALSACAVPAWRAMCVDPMLALRYE